jgi:hypothetical protein
VFLLFLCGDLSGEEDFTKSIAGIVNILDLDNTIVGKMKNVSYLNTDMPLLKFGILVLPSSRFADNEYKLNSMYLDFISRRLKNEQVDWPQAGVSASQEDNSGNVGFVKNPEHGLAGVVLKDDLKDKVRFFLEVYKSKKFLELGVDKTIQNCRGLTFLFYGPPGTGKTMLAEAIASDVGKKLLIAETSKIFCKYLGETDKRIHEMFETARNNDQVLLIDEVDSLIYSRDFASSDFKIRFVNLMLTELERFEGIAILTTNLDSILDNALERRIALKLQFELPTKERRAQIWTKHIPPAFHLAENANIDELARRYEFSGGNIKNAVLAAIRKAIFRNDKVLTMEDLIFGAELEKEGMLSIKNGPKPIKGFVP